MERNQTAKMEEQNKTDCCLDTFDTLITFIKDGQTNASHTWERQRMNHFCYEQIDGLQEHRCLPAHLAAEMNIFTNPIYGYVSPCLGIFTFITNILVCVVLLKKHMRNPTNVLLAAMAIADLLTGMIPVPAFLYFYTLEYYKEWLTCSSLFIYNSMAINLPTIFHTASIWLTVALAVHRYICVCRPISAKKWCNINNVLTAVAVIYALAIVSQCTRFFDERYIGVELPSLLESKTMRHGCKVMNTVLTGEFADVYWNFYWWFRVLFVHLLPCTILVVMNALLITTMRAAQARRTQLLKQNRNSECRRLQENNRTTFMLVAVVFVFLLVELPLAVMLILMILQNSLNLDLLGKAVNDIASIIINMFILLSYPINFFIYCGMSRQFRETFIEVIKSLCKREEPPEQNGRTRYMSLTTENGNKTIAVNETAVMNETAI